MIRINLLGKKKTANVPFGLDEKFEKLGIDFSQVQEMRPALVRAAITGVFLYSASFVPGYLHDEKLRILDADLAKLTHHSAELQKELVSKKDVRKQMEQLNKEESELQRQLNAVSALQQGRTTAFNTLNDLMVQLSKAEKVWIDEIKYDNRHVSLSGKSWEYFPVNEFVKSITESTRYANVLFKDIVAESPRFKLIPGVPEAMQKTKKFSIEFSVKDVE